MCLSQPTDCHPGVPGSNPMDNYFSRRVATPRITLRRRQHQESLHNRNLSHSIQYSIYISIHVYSNKHSSLINISNFPELFLQYSIRQEVLKSCCIFQVMSWLGLVGVSFSAVLLFFLFAASQPQCNLHICTHKTCKGCSLKSSMVLCMIGKRTKKNL